MYSPPHTIVPPGDLIVRARERDFGRERDLGSKCDIGWKVWAEEDIYIIYGALKKPGERLDGCAYANKTLFLTTPVVIINI